MIADQHELRYASKEERQAVMQFVIAAQEVGNLLKDEVEAYDLCNAMMHVSNTAAIIANGIHKRLTLERRERLQKQRKAR